MGDYDYWDLSTGEGLDDDELHRRYDDMLDEVYGEVTIGYDTFQPSELVRELRPVTYRVGFSEWVDQELGETITEDEPEDDEDEEDE